MKCRTIREELERAFDEGAERDAAVETHLRACAGCRRYAERLDALTTGLRALPVETPSPTLEARLGRIGEPEAPPQSWVRVLAAGGALAAFAAVVVGWRYPLPPLPVELLAHVEDFAVFARPQLPPLPAPEIVAAWVRDAGAWAAASAPQAPNPVLWAVAFASAAALAGINGFEAIRQHARDSAGGRRKGEA